MEIKVNESTKIVEVWLTNAEKANPYIREELKPLYAKYKAQKFTVAVYESGNRDLYPMIRDLLAHNRKRVSELAVQHEKCRPSHGLVR